MFEVNRREVVGKTLMDFAKVLFAAQLASGFFAKFGLKIQLVSLLILVLSFATICL